MAGPIEPRTYRRSECVVFRKTDGPFGGLSNMAPGYPLSVNDVLIHTSEALYQACRFPHLQNVQHLILTQNSPMTAKMRTKPYREQSRPDWDEARLPIMRWCLRVKLVQNWGKFRSLLMSTDERAIVEDSRRDDFWGAIATKEDPYILEGCNVLGRLLMELRERIRGMGDDGWDEVSPLNIPDFMLYGQPIGPVLKACAPVHRTRQAGFAALEAY